MLHCLMLLGSCLLHLHNRCCEGVGVGVVGGCLNVCVCDLVYMYMMHYTHHIHPPHTLFPCTPHHPTLHPCTPHHPTLHPIHHQASARAQAQQRALELQRQNEQEARAMQEAAQAAAQQEAARQAAAQRAEQEAREQQERARAERAQRAEQEQAEQEARAQISTASPSSPPAPVSTVKRTPAPSWTPRPTTLWKTQGAWSPRPYVPPTPITTSLEETIPIPTSESTLEATPVVTPVATSVPAMPAVGDASTSVGDVQTAVGDVGDVSTVPPPTAPPVVEGVVVSTFARALAAFATEGLLLRIPSGGGIPSNTADTSSTIQASTTAEGSKNDTATLPPAWTVCVCVCVFICVCSCVFMCVCSYLCVCVIGHTPIHTFLPITTFPRWYHNPQLCLLWMCKHSRVPHYSQKTSQKTSKRCVAWCCVLASVVCWLVLCA